MNYRRDIEALESAYQKFIEENMDAQSTSDVEYMGINLSDSASQPTTFKIYYTTAKSSEDIPSIIAPLVEKDIIRAVNKVDDTIHTGCIRYEIGLKSRTNQNMEFVYQWLLSIYAGEDKHQEEIRFLRDIKCTSLADYRLAALYFIGFVAEATCQIESPAKAIKLHYLLRECRDPNDIGKNYFVNNDNYLKLLCSSPICELRKVAWFTWNILNQASGELWMAAVDYFVDGRSKYKIYFKKFSSTVYEYLIIAFNEIGCKTLATLISQYAQWIDYHPELERYGIAICLDSESTWSVNFYH